MAQSTSSADSRKPCKHYASADVYSDNESMGDTEPNSLHKPIEEHGMIGNMRTCALISTDAYITWFCCM